MFKIILMFLQFIYPFLVELLVGKKSEIMQNASIRLLFMFILLTSLIINIYTIKTTYVLSKEKANGGFNKKPYIKEEVKKVEKPISNEVINNIDYNTDNKIPLNDTVNLKKTPYIKPPTRKKTKKQNIEGPVKKLDENTMNKVHELSGE